ncbi:MAG: 50S ribosomal protein L6 [bacterium]|nr:50S ribosomal protein L6 [bacterium]
MSKIGKKPIAIPEGTEVVIKDGVVEIKSKLGSLRLMLLNFINIDIKDGFIKITPKADHKQARANWGTMAALIKNAIVGVNDGFEKFLEIEGIGFTASMDGSNLTLKVGFSHPVKFSPPEGVKVSVEKGVIKVAGIDRALVGEAAAKIRSIKKPEPYKGKGIRYRGEVVRRKAGKKVAGSTAS